MKFRNLGSSGFFVSELCLGAMQFGWLTDEEKSFAILDSFRAVGGNFIQTKSVVLPKETSPALGYSEKIVGSWLRRTTDARERLVLSTRICLAGSSGGEIANVAKMVRRRCEESLNRLETDYLDHMVLEWDPTMHSVDDGLEALDNLIQAGLVRSVGAAGLPVWRLMEALGRSAALGVCRFESFQTDFSLLERSGTEPDAAELARAYGIAILAQSPLGGGCLTGRYHLPQSVETARTRRMRERYGNVRGHSVMSALFEVARELDATTGQVALAWVLSRPGLTAVLPGFTAPGQVREAAESVALTLSPAQLDRLEMASRRVPGAVAPHTLETANLQVIK